MKGPHVAKTAVGKASYMQSHVNIPSMNSRSSERTNGVEGGGDRSWSRNSAPADGRGQQRQPQRLGRWARLGLGEKSESSPGILPKEEQKKAMEKPQQRTLLSPLSLLLPTGRLALARRDPEDYWTGPTGGGQRKIVL